MEQGHVTGLELDQEALDIARRSAHEMGLEQVVEFFPAERDRIPMPDYSYDALVSEFIVYPTSIPTKIGQAEMARLLKPGGNDFNRCDCNPATYGPSAPGPCRDWIGLHL